MAIKTKKVILFIVDGPTDEDALSPVLKKIFHNKEIRFHVVHGDITSEWMLNRTNAIKTVKEHIQIEVDRYGFKHSDIISVVHLIDTDGAFIPKANVVQGEVEKLSYKENQIISTNPQNIIDRNSRKSTVVHRLYSSSSIWSIPYAVYYFSRNMEHVLHNKSEDLTDDEKMEYADCFADTFDENPKEFITFLSNSDFTVTGNYGESWCFIFEGTNSLHRHCNLHLLFMDMDK